ncbi:hypothetical protein ACIRBZ_43270 [Streptomyces sp. NPDC094038]|uniref:hypothetical protein n=1 Tax=Streptomyces sp. NPDC094038 TaxID=3366055 RepID=UPI0037F7693F
MYVVKSPPSCTGPKTVAETVRGVLADPVGPPPTARQSHRTVRERVTSAAAADPVSRDVSAASGADPERWHGRFQAGNA